MDNLRALDLIGNQLSELGLTAPKSVRTGLSVYVEELERWNQRVNLTALKGEHLVRKLVVEPIWIGRELAISGKVVDIGSGNGSPAIPLALARDLTAVHLIEARLRRAAFLRHIAAKLSLRQISVHQARLENLPQPLGEMDWVTLQGVSPTSGLLRNLARMVTGRSQVVWLTGSAELPPPKARQVLLPGGQTRAWVFQLDHS